jgi:heterodisulfide reductase subunit A-like polyferredoxin
MARMLDWTADESGFMPRHGSGRQPAPAGIFSGGSVTGPMAIADSVSSAEKAVFDMVRYLTASI